MDITKITDSLSRVFEDEDTRIVFWNDPDGEFIETVPSITLAGVTVLRLEDIGSLEAKIRIERDDPAGRYLLYSPAEEPEYEDDWLLDMRLYGRSFRADRASLILQALGLAHQHLRQHLTKRRKFFDNKDRLHKLAALTLPEDLELDLDRKMLAVVAKAGQPELFDIVRTLLHSMADSGEAELDAVPPAWESIEKFELNEPFWLMVESTFGYSENSPSLRNLLIRLLVADYAHHLGKALPASLQHLLLPRSGAANAVVCSAQWRDSSSQAGSYDLLSTAVGSILHLQDHLDGYEVEDLLDVPTFLEVEKRIVQGLLERVTSAGGAIGPGTIGPGAIDLGAISGIVARRQAGHWVSSASVPDDQRKARRAVYQALTAAARFLHLRNEHAGGFDFPDFTAMYKGYESDLYRFDQMYRHFCEQADAAARGWDVLKTLREDLEACYANGYLTAIALAWGKFVDAELPGRWAVDGVPNQYTFYSRQVRPWLDGGDKRRAFVIISDAMRYEIAHELTAHLNSTYRLQAELSSQLSVLPSYTALGMASLLPHDTLEYTAKGAVLADGKPTASLEQRSEILAANGGMAVKAGQLLALNKEQGRDILAGQRLVYIYHDEIDARGDKASTEGGTFEAARKTIQDVADLVRYVVNKLNGNYVVITADHGFLFTGTAPGDPEKSELESKPAGTVVAKKRYLLGTHLPSHEQAWRGATGVTAKAAGGMQFWIPKGANRFHFTGGARFVHGGAMPQEIVVPVIKVKHIKNKGARDKTQIKHVSVQVLGNKHMITAASHRFNLLQMEPVGGRAKAITLKVAVYEGDQPVTSIATVPFDSPSLNLDDRQKSVLLTLRDRPYHKHTPYRLLLRDAETGIEQASIGVVIDRAIADDFDF
ncbi:MAG: BREX-1 system phosphatase PglZ type A [Gammaproteobacteria bacterium]|nr:BREX-1 system phosphatase PglZ type A [Gammaproteobacteria bacterium]